MKKLLTFAAAFVICTSVSAQENWRVAATIGSFGNQSVYSGGNSNASALFNHNKYGVGMLGVLFRKQVSHHLSFQTGLNISSLGFNYTMSQDYSLLQPKSHFIQNQVSTGLATIPVTAIWNFNPNCKNVRWFVGAGFSLVHAGSTNTTNSVAPTQSEQQALNISSNDYISQTVNANAFTVLNGHVMFGVEKTFKRGTMLSLAAYFNRGFAPVATSNVTYTVNGQTYNHSFTNYNNYSGLTLSYYFKPMKSKAAAIKK